MSQVISKLKDKKLVTEQASDSHAKRKHLHLTQQGEDAAGIAEAFKTRMRDTELQAYLFVTKFEAFHAETLRRWHTPDSALG